jgi:hypothetical protein
VSLSLAAGAFSPVRRGGKELNDDGDYRASGLSGSLRACGGWREQIRRKRKWLSVERPRRFG